jgi:mono/diheme cytochrome c family protein
MRLLLGLASTLALIGAGISVTRAQTSASPLLHYADADDMATVLAGQRIYKTHCTQCHGRSLQGQALWRLDDEYANQRAPALDGTGHAWQHSDEALFQRVALGRWPDATALAPNPMPIFQAVLRDQDILAVIAFIKSRWGVGLRAAQSTLNPDLMGMPPNVADADWTLPPTCSSTQQRWRTVSAPSITLTTAQPTERAR